MPQRQTAIGASTFGSGNYLGSDFNFLRNEFKNLYEEGDPAIAQQIKAGNKRIGMQARERQEDIEEQGAQSGFRGAQANLYNALFEEESQQTEELNVQGAQMQSAVKQQALAQMMGLTQFEGQQNLNVAGQEESIRQYEKTFQENVRQFGMEYALKQRELDLKEEEQNSGGFLGGLGSIVGGLAGMATGGLGSGLGSWLGNEIGEWLG